MLLLEPDRTPYDLNWRMFGIPVRVNPWFWLVSAIMGWNALQDGFPYLLLWIGCVFVSILIHELGHVFAGRIFGSDGHIVLYSFGGLAIGSSDLSKRWQRIAVYFAGPMAEVLLSGVIILALGLLNPERFRSLIENIKFQLGLPFDIRAMLLEKPTLVTEAIDYLVWFNMIWGLMNLVPIWPLDGGQISRDVFDWLMPRQGLRVSLGISLALAGLLAVAALAGREFYLAFLFGFLAFSSFQALQQVRARQTWDAEPTDPWERNRAPWERDPDYWKK